MTQPARPAHCRAHRWATSAVATTVALAVLAALPLASAGAATRSTDDGDPLAARGVVVQGAAAPPKVLAESWVVVDAATGDVLAAKNAHERRRPASTLKTLTAVTLLPRLDLDDVYRVQWADAHVVGSAVGVVPGSRYTVDQLFYGLMLPSGNDAARALARAAGGVHTTVAAMNRVADRLGAHDTHAVNPTGLDGPRQLTSAFDLAIFARAGLTDRDFRRYVSTVSFAFPAEESKRDAKRQSYMIYNQNPLLLSGYRGVLGVKTGYTTEAGRTFVGAAERGGRTVIVALMGVVESSETAATKLLDWAFARGRHATPVGSLVEPAEPETAPVVPQDPSPPQAAAVGGAHLASSAGSGPLAVTAWAVVALVLLGATWWMWRRRAGGSRR